MFMLLFNGFLWTRQTVMKQIKTPTDPSCFVHWPESFVVRSIIVKGQPRDFLGTFRRNDETKWKVCLRQISLKQKPKRSFEVYQQKRVSWHYQWTIPKSFSTQEREPTRKMMKVLILPQSSFHLEIYRFSYLPSNRAWINSPPVWLYQHNVCSVSRNLPTKGANTLPHTSASDKPKLSFLLNNPLKRSFFVDFTPKKAPENERKI